MARQQALGTKTITAGDIKRRHPRYLTCKTDKAYAQLANDIYELLKDGCDFMEERQLRNACISLALHFEDMRSHLHLFETFTRMYQKRYGCYLPFYSTAGADAPDAPLDAMRFMLWHSCVAERNGAVLNPTNNGLKGHAARLLNFWKERKLTLPVNEELADFLYAEETQTDVDLVKTVLVWLNSYCTLGRWFTNPTEAEKIAETKDLLHGMDKETIAYAADCYELFSSPTWPLSVTPQHVYAEMIRIDMDDPDDELAETIERMEGKPFSIYEVMGSEGDNIRLKDFLGQVISVSQREFFGNVKQLLRQNTHLGGAFILFDGAWHLSGPCLWSKPVKKEIDARLDKLRYQHHLMHDFAGYYDSFINSHGGERLYFFRNAQEHRQWLISEMHQQYGELPLFDELKDLPLAVFFEDNGQMTTCFETACIKHPANPCYDPLAADEQSMMFFVQEYFSPGMLFYMMAHDLLPDIKFNDIRGNEHGRLLMQDNIDFIARCLRRDFTTDTIARKRTFLAEEDDFSFSKQSFEAFVRLLAAEDEIRSKANKEWKVVQANATTTVIRDVTRRQNHHVPTRKLYEAHLALDAKEIQVATLVPFVGREHAPAASALLYNIVGLGMPRNSLRKFVRNAMEHGGFDELKRMLSELHDKY